MLVLEDGCWERSIELGPKSAKTLVALMPTLRSSSFWPMLPTQLLDSGFEVINASAFWLQRRSDLESRFGELAACGLFWVLGRAWS